MDEEGAKMEGYRRSTAKRDLLEFIKKLREPTSFQDRLTTATTLRERIRGVMQLFLADLFSLLVLSQLQVRITWCAMSPVASKLTIYILSRMTV